MKSMTGYGSATEVLGGREITAEIRSVISYINAGNYREAIVILMSSEKLAKRQRLL